MKRLIGIVLLLLVSGLLPAHAASCDTPLTDAVNQSQNKFLANRLELEFDSGSQWELCWRVDDNSGLVLSHIYFAAPGMPLQKVMESASIAQIVFQYDEDTRASHLISEFGLGGENWNEDAQSCENGEWVVGTQHRICQQRRELNLLARARHYRSLPRNEITLQGRSTIGLNKFQQVWRFTEDGEIKPSLTYSGKISRYTNNSNFGAKVDNSERYASNATLLVNWRLDFNINGTPNNDRVDEFNFVGEASNDLTRKMTVNAIDHEAFRDINNTDFRGWRISDNDTTSGSNGHLSPTRIGYYLDPQPSGYRLISDTKSWTEFDLAITNRRDCEQLASGNKTINQECSADLGNFVNNERLEDPVLWFSLTRHFTPSKEDFPAIRSNEIEFSLIPFDWSASSPFSNLAVPITDSVGQPQ